MEPDDFTRWRITLDVADQFQVITFTQRLQNVARGEVSLDNWRICNRELNNWKISISGEIDNGRVIWILVVRDTEIGSVHSDLK